MPIDIFADGDFGQWALDQVDSSDVGYVVTSDRTLAENIGRIYPNVILGRPAEAHFRPQRIAICIHYHYIFTAKDLESYDAIYNIHPGFLPWGRGMYPVFWALWQQTPAGATLHKITELLDRGPVVAQLAVEQRPTDTGGTLRERVRVAEHALFREYWPRLVSGEVLETREQVEGGSYHSARQFEQIRRNPDLRLLGAGDLLRLARALAFPGCSGLELDVDGTTCELTFTPR